MEGSIMLLRFLLNSGTNIETKSDMGNTALLYAAQVRRTLSHGMLTRRFLLIWRAFSLVTWTWCTSLFSAAATYTLQTVPIVYGRCMRCLFFRRGFFSPPRESFVCPQSRLQCMTGKPSCTKQLPAAPSPPCASAYKPVYSHVSISPHARPESCNVLYCCGESRPLMGQQHAPPPPPVSLPRAGIDPSVSTPSLLLKEYVYGKTGAPLLHPAAPPAITHPLTPHPTPHRRPTPRALRPPRPLLDAQQAHPLLPRPNQPPWLHDGAAYSRLV
jgi:hypothetical protein